MSIDDFCSKCIDPMGEESDHIQLVALTNALRVPVRVVYLDNSQSGLQVPNNSGVQDSSSASAKADVHDFVPDGAAQDISIHILYRPGHYDILYSV